MRNRTFSEVRAKSGCGFGVRTCLVPPFLRLPLSRPVSLLAAADRNLSTSSSSSAGQLRRSVYAKSRQVHAERSRAPSSNSVLHPFSLSLPTHHLDNVRHSSQPLHSQVLEALHAPPRHSQSDSR